MFDIDPIYIKIFLGVVSALILFLYAIENLSQEFQALASERFRELIAKMSRNRLMGTLVGAFSTAVIQSSSAVSVIAVMLVNTGVISFRNSLGILFGANIGTTITAQLALVSSTMLAPVLIIIGTVIKLAGKKFKLIGKPIFFLGFILFTLNLLSSTIAPLSDSPQVVEIFANLSNPFIAFSFSALFTAIIHSSSVTSGIIVILAMQGLIPIEVAISMILGANLGSSITAYIASSRLSLHAKRAGLANVMFNLLGTTLFLLLLSPFIFVLSSIIDGVAKQAALAHVMFNVINAGIFLILLSPFEKLIIKLLPGDEQEVLFRPKYLNGDNQSPSNQIQNIKREIVYSIENTAQIYQEAIGIYYNPTKQSLMKIQKLESLNDYLDDQITKAIVKLAKNKLSIVDAHSSVLLVKISNTIEQIGDLGEDLSDIFTRVHELNFSNKDVCIEQLSSINTEYLELLKELIPLILEPTEEKLKEIRKMELSLLGHIQEYFDIHVVKLQEEDDYNGNVFVDAVSVLELATAKVRSIRKLFEV